MTTALALVLLLSAQDALAQTSDSPPLSDAPIAAPTKEPQLLKSSDGLKRYRYVGEVPPGFALIEQPRWTLLGAGIGAFGAGYLAGGITGALLGNGLGFIPLVGPIASVLTYFTPISGLGFTAIWAAPLLMALAIVETAAQVAGITMFTISLVSRQRWLEKEGETAAPKVTLLPMAPGAQVGASLVARF